MSMVRVRKRSVDKQKLAGVLCIAYKNGNAAMAARSDEHLKLYNMGHKLLNGQVESLTSLFNSSPSQAVLRIDVFFKEEGGPAVAASLEISMSFTTLRYSAASKFQPHLWVLYMSIARVQTDHHLYLEPST